MSEPNSPNKTDAILKDIFHSKAFKIYASIVGSILGIILLATCCLFTLFLISIIIPGLGAIGLIVTAIISFILSLLSIPNPNPPYN